MADNFSLCPLVIFFSIPKNSGHLVECLCQLAELSLTIG
jgi:hypothetical protein